MRRSTISIKVTDPQVIKGSFKAQTKFLFAIFNKVGNPRSLQTFKMESHATKVND